MAANRAETSNGDGDIVALPNSGARPGGIKAWLPLIVTMALMPALAWATTTYLIIPKLQKSLGLAPSSASHEAPSGEAHGKAGGTATAPNELVTMNKLLVNVSGTLGSRYLLTSFTVAGGGADFKTKLEKQEAQLRDLACGILSTKTINDIEKPTIRNQIRSEIITGFNNVLGDGTVKELYITEFAIQ